MNVQLPSKIQHHSRMAFLIALAGSALCIAGVIFNPTQLVQSWLMAWLFFAGLSFGALIIFMMQTLTGGAWGMVIRRFCEAAMMTLPLVALLFLPVILGAHDIFPWSRADALAAHPDWTHKHGYLNLPFFILRSCFYFASLGLLAFLLRRFSFLRERTSNPAPPLRWVSRLSAGGLVFYVLCMNFASTDWLMSLEPDWYSTVFVVIFMASQFLCALALMTALLAMLATYEPFAAVVTAKHFHDLGNMLLTFVIFWTYVSFAQLLVIWSGNLPKEISWYLHRSDGGWQWLAVFLALFEFLVPLALLLFRNAKRNRAALGVIAALILLAGLANVYWMVMPAFHPEGIRIHWLDFAALIAVGGFWSALFLRILKTRPFLPQEALIEVGS